jgi:hypothetical protein
LIVDDCPILLSHNKSSTHSIIHPEEDFTIPLELHGIISYFTTRKPTAEEMDQCQWVERTDGAEWN